MNEEFERFMRESNWIEGEREGFYVPTRIEPWIAGKLHPNDLRVMHLMYDKARQDIDPCEDDLLRIHLMLAEVRPDLRLQWKGEYRQCPVFIGTHEGLDWKKIKKAMALYFLEWDEMDPWTAHARYEKIHPFEDLNGRTGRILWAWSMIRKGHNPFRLPFLHCYYYQSLSAYRE